MDTLARVERIGVLRAYKWVVSVAAPDLHADLEARSERWGRASPEQLSDELAGFLREASRVSCPVRLFFKVRAELVYGGCNTPSTVPASARLRTQRAPPIDAAVGWTITSS